MREARKSPSSENLEHETSRREILAALGLKSGKNSFATSPGQINIVYRCNSTVTQSRDVRS